jgi:alpha-aminoadipic semialdehyde synthase
VGGSVEATVRTTTPDDPVYVYDVASGTASDGFTGAGPVVIAIDNLPAEIPRDASDHFGDALFPFVDSLVGADFDRPFDRLALPPAILGGLVAHRGELTPDYRYLESALDAVCR